MGATWRKLEVFLRLVAIVALVALAIRIAEGSVKPDVATAVVMIVLVAALIAALGPADLRQAFARMSKLKLGSLLEAEFKEAEEKADKAAGAEDTDPDSKRKARSLVELRLLLEAKMAFVAKNQFAKPSYVTVGSLNYDGGLSDEDALTATKLMTYREEDLAALPQGQRMDFLEEAYTLVKSFRVKVLHGFVERWLTKNRWSVLEIPREGQRPDFLAEKDGRRLRVAPVFAESPDSKILSTALERLEGTENHPPEVDGRIVVIPDNAKDETVRAGDPRVLKFDSLATALSA